VVNTFKFGKNNVSQIIKGNWQLAGGHGDIDRTKAIQDLFTYVSHGVNTFDVGDIYTGVEEIVGDFLAEYRKKYGKQLANKLHVHTKFVPDLDTLEQLNKDDVRKVINRSIKRLSVEHLNLVQFHWWDFTKGDYVKVAKYLKELQEEGLIDAIGLTNFDCHHMQVLLDAEIPIKSNQVQFSLIDPRPLNGMLELAKKNSIAIFCYGVLAGGLLANSKPTDEPTNRSHIKYKLVIDEIGDYHYQKVLKTISSLAKQYDTTPANIAATYVLQTPGVSAVIIGPRNSQHINEVDDLTKLKLAEQDLNTLQKLGLTHLKGSRGDIYSYERNRQGPHGKIMKYNLNGMKKNV
jgi:aryl-alcohol dehydrogenase-like predicted oxidoreductase